MNITKYTTKICRRLLKYFLVACCGMTLTSSTMHPIHISYTKIEVQGEKIELLIKVFSDDLSLAVTHGYGCNPCTQSAILSYFEKTCKVFSDEKLLVWNFERKEHKDDADWYYFSSSSKKISKISVENTMMYNIYEDQKNLVVIVLPGIEKGFILTPQSYTCNYKL